MLIPVFVCWFAHHEEDNPMLTITIFVFCFPNLLPMHMHTQGWLVKLVMGWLEWDFAGETPLSRTTVQVEATFR